MGVARIVAKTVPMFKIESEYSYPVASKCKFIASFETTGRYSKKWMLGSNSWKFVITRRRWKKVSTFENANMSISIMWTMICKFLTASRRGLRPYDKLEKQLALLKVTAAIVLATITNAVPRSAVIWVYSSEDYLPRRIVVVYSGRTAWFALS